jgi:hypothetical protein
MTHRGSADAGRLCEHRRMRSRRTAITLLAVLILVVGALSAAERDRTRDKTATAPAVPAQAQTQKTGRQVVATLPADSPVRAKVGDSVVLRVKSDTPDIAQMLQLGLSWSVGPKLPGTMQYVADAPGTFAVTLEVAGTVGGIVQVR